MVRVSLPSVLREGRWVEPMAFDFSDRRAVSLGRLVV